MGPFFNSFREWVINIIFSSDRYELSQPTMMLGKFSLSSPCFLNLAKGLGGGEQIGCDKFS